MELRIYGTLIHGTTDLWNHGNTNLRNYGKTEIRSYGSTDFGEGEKGWALGTEATPLAFCLGGGDGAWVRRRERCLG